MSATLDDKSRSNYVDTVKHPLSQNEVVCVVVGLRCDGKREMNLYKRINGRNLSERRRTERFG